jgi:hypothetical protein
VTLLVPVRLAEDGFRRDPAAEPELRDRLEQVLRYYGVPYQRTEHGLRVDGSVAADTDLVWNFTTKAQDPEWLAGHPGQG